VSAAERDPVSVLRPILERSRELGFLGPGPIDRHVAHAGQFARLVPAGTVLDLGTGGGLPGLVLGVERDEPLVLLDANERRCRFLERAVAELGLHHVAVRCGRAEVLARDVTLRGRFDAVVARSFGPPPVTLECAMGFLRGPGSELLVSEPPDGGGRRWPDDALAGLGVRRAELVEDERGSIQRLVLVAPVPDRLPRRVGIPAKRPLF
jgi:16S rRNA (guanine527-N7)-methyltransferase